MENSSVKIEILDCVKDDDPPVAPSAVFFDEGLQRFQAMFFLKQKPDCGKISNNKSPPLRKFEYG